MSQRLEEFLRELPGKGVPENAVQLYRSVLEDLETFLGRAAALRFSRYEVNRFVTQRQRAGAGEREIKNLNTACAAYLSYCEAQAPAPAVGTADEADTSPAALAEAPPPQERRKVLFVVAGVGALLLCLIGGCLVDKARQSRAERAYSDELFRLAQATNGDRPALRAQIEAAAHQRGIRIGQMSLGVSPLNPANLNKLPMEQRMRAMAAMQAQLQRSLPPPGLDRINAPPRHAVDAPLWYVEIQMIGQVKGLFGSSKIDFELHVLGGASPVPPPPGAP